MVSNLAAADHVAFHWLSSFSNSVALSPSHDRLHITHHTVANLSWRKLHQLHLIKMVMYPKKEKVSTTWRNVWGTAALAYVLVLMNDFKEGMLLICHLTEKISSSSLLVQANRDKQLKQSRSGSFSWKKRRDNRKAVKQAGKMCCSWSSETSSNFSAALCRCAFCRSHIVPSKPAFPCSGEWKQWKPSQH